jgi:molybdopterin-guanine dinucleotide biosynthesis protein A
VISHFGVFWDRETGILSGMSTILEYYDEDSNLMLTAKVDIVIVETNLWTKTAPRQDKTIWPTIVTLIVLLSILVVAVVLFRKRKRKRKVGLRR